MPQARSAGTRSRSARSALLLAIAGTFGAWLGGKLDDRLGPKHVIAASTDGAAVALVHDPADRQGLDLVRQGRAAGAGRPLFAAAAERAYLCSACLIGGAAGPLQAAARTLLIRLAPKDRIAQYFGLFALTGKVRRSSGRCWSASSPR